MARLNDRTRRDHVVATFAELQDMNATATACGITRDNVRRHLKQAGVTTKAVSLAEALPPQAVPEPVRLDVVEAQRYQNEIKALKASEKRLTKRLVAAEEHRASILGLTVEPARLEPSMLNHKFVKGDQAIVLHITDTHVGETIKKSEVAGVNSYDREIARKRMGRLFEKASILSTSAWPASDKPPSRVVILLGGDLISGHGLHPEHAETDYGTAMEQVKDAAQWIAAGILRLHLELQEKFKRPALKAIPFDVIRVVGNHGRMTFGKPRTKLVTLQSYDSLVGDFVESALREYPTIRHFSPEGFDAYFNVVGWPCLLTHGDRMGSGGGTGFIGPMATIIKGHRKIMDTEHRQRRPVRFIWSGHFHTSGVTPFGFGGGAMCGYGEFAKSIRADPEPAQQLYTVMHERLGLIRYQPIILGTPDEGSMYEPNAGLILPTLTN